MTTTIEKRGTVALASGVEVVVEVEVTTDVEATTAVEVTPVVGEVRSTVEVTPVDRVTRTFVVKIKMTCFVEVSGESVVREAMSLIRVSFVGKATFGKETIKFPS